MSARQILRILLARNPVGAVLRRVLGLPTAYARGALRRSDPGGLQVGVSPRHAVAAAPPIQRRLGPCRGLRALDRRHRPGAPLGIPALFWLQCSTDARGEPRRTIAAGEGAVGLDVIDGLEATAPADTLLAAGALQYMPDAMPGLLERLPSRQSHLLINKVALTAGEGFWTLQNIGPAAVPYRVCNRAEFLGYFTAAGYHLRDAWDVAELAPDMPFHPRHSVAALAGFYLGPDATTRSSG